MSYLWNSEPSPVFDTVGNFASGAFAYFYTDNSTTPLTVYQDSALTIPHAWPVVANQTGVFPSIYIPYGYYRRRITTADGVLISDAGNIDNPQPPTAGLIVTADEIFQTGDPLPRWRTGILTGWVRMNGLTLGDASSGATEYAASDAANLFTYLWTWLPDSIAPVSTGRGASATADFAANKTIVIPTMQGIIAAGVDTMGATAAGRIQAVTTCSPPGGSGVIPVTSATGIAVGQNVWINGSAAGVVNSISGTNITISTSPAVGVNVEWRSSFFADAQQPGQLAGGANATMTSDQMPSHTHTVTDPGHTHTMATLANAAYVAGAANGPISSGGLTTFSTNSATTGVTNQNTGGGHPMGILQPTRLFTWYLKL